MRPSKSIGHGTEDAQEDLHLADVDAMMEPSVRRSRSGRSARRSFPRQSDLSQGKHSGLWPAVPVLGPPYREEDGHEKLDAQADHPGQDLPHDATTVETGRNGKLLRRWRRHRGVWYAPFLGTGHLGGPLSHRVLAGTCDAHAVWSVSLWWEEEEEEEEEAHGPS